jgi:hypothetical protein
MSNLTPAAQRILDDFGTQPGVTTDQLGNLRSALDGSPALTNQFNEAVQKGYLKHITPLNDPTMGGGLILLAGGTAYFDRHKRRGFVFVRGHHKLAVACQSPPHRQLLSLHIGARLRTLELRAACSRKQRDPSPPPTKAGCQSVAASKASQQRQRFL